MKFAEILLRQISLESNRGHGNFSPTRACLLSSFPKQIIEHFLVVSGFRLVFGRNNP
jgi:hypothetical protein